MKITVTISHDFETIKDAMAFAAELEPITQRLEAPRPSIAAETVADAASLIDREHAETLNPSLADRMPSVEPSGYMGKRHRRTKAEIEAARAAEAAATPPAPVAPVAPIEPTPLATVVSDALEGFDEPITVLVPVKLVSEADLKIEYQGFVQRLGDKWRSALPVILGKFGSERISAVPADKRAELVAALRSYAA